MFWQFGFHDSSTIDALLEKENVTLKEVLDESTVIQETKGQNKQLIEFLLKPENFTELMEMITVSPGEDEPLEIRYKYPSVACDVLSSEVKPICAAFFDASDRLETLWSCFQRPLPMHPLEASFITRVLIALVQKQPNEMSAFIRAKGSEGIIDVLRHLGTNGVLEFVKKLMNSHVSSENNEIQQWLSQCDFVGTIVSMLHGVDPNLVATFDYGTTDEEVIVMTIANARDLLLDMVNVREELSIGQYEDTTPMQLLGELTMPLTLKTLTDVTFRDPGLLPGSFSQCTIADGVNTEQADSTLEAMVDDTGKEKAADESAEKESAEASGDLVMISAGEGVSPTVNVGVEAGMTIIEKVIHRYQIQRRGVDDPFKSMTGEPIMLTMEQKQERSSELQTLLPIFDAVEKCIPYLKTILKTTPRPNPLYKSAITPFGRLRLSALELLYRLVCSRVPAIDAAIAKEDILSVCMDLFFRYSNNTFLHVTVTKIVYEILRLKEPRTKPVASVDHREVYESEYRPVPELTPADVKVGATDTCAEGKEVDDAVAQEATVALYRSLFNECGICNRLLKAVDESAKRKDGHRRPTYMSHVYQLANMIERSLRGETHALTTKESILRKIRTGEPKKDTEEAQAPDNTNNASTGVFVPKEWVRFVGDELMVDNASLALPLGGKRPTDPLSHFGDSDEDMNAMEDDAAQLGLHRILAQQLAEEPEDFDSNINFDDENNAVLNRLEAVAAATKSQNENHNSAESEFTSDYFSSALQSAFDDPVDEGLSSGSNRSSVDENADPWKDAFDMLKDEVHKAANGDNDDPMGEGNEAVTDEWDAFEAAAPPNATKDDVGGVFKAATANENDDMWGAFETADDDKSDKPGTANRQLDTTVTGSGDDEDGWADFKGASS